MTVLKAEDYNKSYFDGKLVSKPHPDGYYEYARNDFLNAEIKRYLKQLNSPLLVNKKILELGCAKGFLVEDLRNLEVNAWGIDISRYAINNAPASVKQYVKVGDMRDLSAYRNKEFDLVYSVRSLECLEPMELHPTIEGITRIAKNQIHIVDEPSYGTSGSYTFKSINNWKLLFPKGTKIISYQTNKIIKV